MKLQLISGPISIPFLFLRSVPVICGSKKLLSLCLIPYLIGCVSFCIYVFCAFYFREDLSGLLVSEEGWLSTSLTWLLFFVNIALSSVLALITTITIGAFFIESFIVELLIREGLFKEEDESILSAIKSILRELKDDLKRLLVVALLTVLMLLAGLFGPLAVVPPVLGAFLVGYDILDLPLLLLKTSFRQRWGLVRRHILDVLALGALFSLFLFIPFGGIIFLPAAYYAAVMRIAAWSKNGDLNFSG